MSLLKWDSEPKNNEELITRFRSLLRSTEAEYACTADDDSDFSARMYSEGQKQINAMLEKYPQVRDLIPNCDELLDRVRCW